MEVKRIETGNALILLAPISGGGAETEFLTASDRKHIAGLSSLKRKAEMSAWRSAVRQEGVAGDIFYAETDAPELSEGEKWRCISVAHTGGMAAVILSQHPCAIDIERTERDFDRAASRFVSAAEQNVPGSDGPLFRAAVWCAKETIYKFSGRPGMDFLEDMRINRIDWEAGTISGAVRNGNAEWEERNMEMLLHGNYIVVFMVSGE